LQVETDELTAFVMKTEYFLIIVSILQNADHMFGCCSKDHFHFVSIQIRVKNGVTLLIIVGSASCINIKNNNKKNEP